MKTSDISNYLISIENEFDIYSDRILGIEWFRVARLPLYYCIAVQTQTLSSPHESSSKINIFTFLLETVNFIKGLRRAPVLIIKHPRESLSKTLYSKHVINTYKDKVVLSYFASKDEPSIPISPLLALSKFIQYFLTATRQRKISSELSQRPILQRISEHFNLPLTQLTELCTKEILKHTCKADSFSLFLKIVRPNKIFLSAAYSYLYVIEAAKKNKIETIELQHGIITKHHLGYSFPHKQNIYLFTDKLSVYGNVWGEETSFPPLVQIQQHPYHTPTKDKYFNKQEKLILVSSQGAVAPQLFKFTIELAAKLKDYQFLYRLHPTENRNKPLYQQPTPPNIQISHLEPSIFKLMELAPIQVGVFSTTLYEGILFDCIPVVLNLKGAENMYILQKLLHINLISTVDEFVLALPEVLKADHSWLKNQFYNNDLPIKGQV